VQAESAAASDVSAAPRNSERRAIEILSCRGARGILAPGTIGRWQSIGIALPSK
jgi:hypothetical protein